MCLELSRHLYIVFVISPLSHASFYTELAVSETVTLWLVRSIRMGCTFSCADRTAAQLEMFCLLLYEHLGVFLQRCKTSFFPHVGAYTRMMPFLLLPEFFYRSTLSSRL